jgi:hypothetical protein
MGPVSPNVEAVVTVSPDRECEHEVVLERTRTYRYEETSLSVPVDSALLMISERYRKGKKLESKRMDNDELHTVSHCMESRHLMLCLTP